MTDDDDHDDDGEAEALWRVVQDVELGLATATRARDVQVSAFDGGATVRLTGTVPDEEQRAKALVVARRAPGVTHVIDDLVVAPPKR
jgi:osmotically-inducible protein OsmY